MLQTKTIDPATLELIKSLQSKNYLDGFYLVGGTALALYSGHRLSIDIDLFSNFSFETAELLEFLQQDFPVQLFFTATNTIKGRIENVNIDIIAHRYHYLTEPSVIDGIRILSESDIIAMKLNAISSSGQRSKDFIDIYFILEEKRFSVAEMLKFYRSKYQQESDMHIIKSLIYFDDVDLADWPVLLKKPHLKWDDVKRKIVEEVRLYMKEHTE
jgi:hypothetical protein